MYHNYLQRYLVIFCRFNGSTGLAHINMGFLCKNSCLKNLQSFVWLKTYHNVKNAFYVNSFLVKRM